MLKEDIAFIASEIDAPRAALGWIHLPQAVKHCLPSLFYRSPIFDELVGEVRRPLVKAANRTDLSLPACLVAELEVRGFVAILELFVLAVLLIVLVDYFVFRRHVVLLSK